MQQETAENILKSGENVFITGSAGTGKTFLLNKYIQYLRERRIVPAIVAPTGIAASHLNGQTIHSFFGIGIRETVDNAFIESLLRKKYLTTRFSKVEILIIDEVSMVSPELFSSMDRLLQAFKNSPKPFGGVQVIASGDFFQLPPISKIPKQKRFAWQSPSWKDLDFKSCYLDVKFRQDDDKLIEILDDIRSGIVSESSYKTLNSRLLYELGAEHKPTRLYTHNVDVDRINNMELHKLDERAIVFGHDSKGSKKNIEKIFNSSLVLEDLTLKKGAVVIFIKNSQEQKYVNGTTGVVTGFSRLDGMPMVRTSSGKRIDVDLEDWSMENEDGKIIATVTQVPLRLAWAITIHKSQGMTLDSAEIDLGRTFEVGQGYVALSRLKSIEGLRLMGLNDMALMVDPLILKIDSRIKSASQRATKEIEELSNLSEIKNMHILKSGGVVDKKEIEREKIAIASGKFKIEDKIPTEIKTKNLISEAKSIRELAKKRGVTESTIATHLGKLKEKDKNLDLSKFRPVSKDFDKIIDTITNIKSQKSDEYFTDDGKLRLKPIFEALDEKVSYDKIRLALLFC